MTTRNWALRLPLVFMLAAAPAFAQEDMEGEVALNPDESTTWQGFTGLFNIISPDTLDRGHVSFGLTYRNYDRELSDFDVNDWGAGLSVGVTDRLEFGLNYTATRQVDYDERDSGVFYNNFPFGIDTIEEGSGDLNVGLKAAFARIEETGFGASGFGSVKIPVADEDEGFGTGGTDIMVGAALGWDKDPVAVYGNLSYSFIGDASNPLGGDDISLADMFRWGVGVELGSHRLIRGIVELQGESFLNEDVRAVVPGFGEIEQEEALDMTLGFKIGGAQHGGLTFGAAWQRNLLMDDTDRFSGEKSRPDGVSAEITYTSYSKPEPLPPVPIDTKVPVNRDPTAKVTVTPKEVYPLHFPKVHEATAVCDASDPDGDPLTYSWSATGGRISGSGMTVTWTPPEGVETGTYEITCRVSDGRGGTAEDTDDVRVIPDPECPFGIGKIFFEFDRYDLDAEDRSMLDKVASHLRNNPGLRVKVEGHCCYIATEEYNLALGQHRANAIRAYLTNQGIEANRVDTVSYGESRPWQDNSREITRRLNRRGEFAFSFQSMM